MLARESRGLQYDNAVSYTWFHRLKKPEGYALRPGPSGSAPERPQVWSVAKPDVAIEDAVRRSWDG